MFTKANKTLATFVGNESAEELEGKCDKNIFDPAYSSQAAWSDKKVLLGKTVNFEALVETRSGNKALRVTTNVPLRNRNDDVVGILGISREVTDLEKQKRAESRLSRKPTTGSPKY